MFKAISFARGLEDAFRRSLKLPTLFDAQGSLRDQGLPLIDAEDFLFGEHFRGTERWWPPESVPPVMLKYYGDLPIAKYLRGVFQLGADGVSVHLNSVNLIGDTHPQRKDFFTQYIRTLAENIGLRFHNAAEPRWYLTDSGSGANRTATLLARKYHQQLGDDRPKVMISAHAHALLAEELGTDALIVPVSAGRGFQPDKEVLIRLLNEHRDCGMLVLTAPTTCFNTVELLDEPTLQLIREKNIWLHIDGALAQLLGGLPSAPAAALRKLLESAAVRSLSFNAHKIVGLPANGALALLHSKDRRHLERPLLGAPYISDGEALGLHTTSLSHGPYKRALKLLFELGKEGCFYLILSAHLAALSLAERLRELGLSVISEPAMQAVCLGFSSEDELRGVRSRLRRLSPRPIETAIVPPFHFGDNTYQGIRIVFPLGVHWTKQTIDYLAKSIERSVRGLDESSSVTSKDVALVREAAWLFPELRHPFVTAKRTALTGSEANVLREVPHTWLLRIYECFHQPEPDGHLSPCMLSPTELVNRCREVMQELGSKPAPKPSNLLKMRARYYEEGHQQLRASQLFILPG